MRALFHFSNPSRRYHWAALCGFALALGFSSPSSAVDTIRLSQICQREDESAIGFCFGYLLASLKVAVRNCEIRKDGGKQFIAKELSIAEVGGLNVVDVRSYFLDYATNTPIKDLTKDPEHAVQMSLSRHFPCPQ